VSAHRLAALGGLAALQLFACGGTTSSDPCPSGSCDLPSRTVVKWMFDHYPEWQFDMDSCVDFGVLKVHVDVVDAAGAVTSAEDDCGAGQVTFQDLPEGDYTVQVTPLDADGNPVVNAAALGTVTAGTFGNNTDTTVYVPWTSWVGTYTGTFLFRLSWDGMSCDDAVPPVMTQVVTLMSGGQPLHVATDDGQMLDGTDPKPCKRLSDNFPQSAKDLPFGPATLIVVGRDSGGAKRFERHIDTFIGAGITNPTITYDVTGDMPDAGVDAGVDGGAPVDAP